MSQAAASPSISTAVSATLFWLSPNPEAFGPKKAQARDLPAQEKAAALAEVAAHMGESPAEEPPAKAGHARKAALRRLHTIAADRGALWLGNRLRAAGVRETWGMTLEQLRHAIAYADKD